MYHAIVRRRINSHFDAINRGDAEPLLQGFARQFEHIFIGDHVLAGRRCSLEMTRRWYERLFRLLPDLRFVPYRINVAGMPWNTIATIEWEEENSATDGIKTVSAGVHVVHICWGRITRLLILSDTAVLRDTMHRTETTSGGESLAPALDEVSGWPATG